MLDRLIFRTHSQPQGTSPTQTSLNPCSGNRLDWVCLELWLLNFKYGSPGLAYQAYFFEGQKAASGPPTQKARFYWGLCLRGLIVKKGAHDGRLSLAYKIHIFHFSCSTYYVSFRWCTDIFSLDSFSCSFVLLLWRKNFLITWEKF